MAKAQTAVKNAATEAKVVRAAQTQGPARKSAKKTAAPAPAPANNAPESNNEDDLDATTGQRTIHVLTYVGDDNKEVEQKFTRFSKAVKQMRELLADGVVVTFSRDKAQVEQVITE